MVGKSTTSFGGKIQVEIRNAMGQLISSKVYQEERFIELNLEGANGLYLITVVGEKDQASLKVIKE